MLAKAENTRRAADLFPREFFIPTNLSRPRSAERTSEQLAVAAMLQARWTNKEAQISLGNLPRATGGLAKSEPAPQSLEHYSWDGCTPLQRVSPRPLSDEHLPYTPRPATCTWSTDTLGSSQETRARMLRGHRQTPRTVRGPCVCCVML